jgi:hypothetical protein
MAWNKQAYRPRIVTPDAADRALFTLHTPTGQAPVRLRLPGDPRSPTRWPPRAPRVPSRSVILWDTRPDRPLCQCHFRTAGVVEGS